MSVDVEALKVLAAEKKLPLERLINAIENEVAAAYASLPGAKPHGRAVLNRQSGELVIYVPVLGPDGDRIDTVTDNPDGFAKLANKTARKVIKEKMREAKDLEVAAVLEHLLDRGVTRLELLSPAGMSASNVIAGVNRAEVILHTN